MHPDTINLWLVDPDANVLRMTNNNRTLDYTIEYEDCYHELQVLADFSDNPLDVMLPEIMVTGRGAVGTPDEFDFTIRAMAQESEIGFESPCDDDTDPPTPPEADCAWKQEIIKPVPPIDSCVDSSFALHTGWRKGGWATWNSLTGTAKAAAAWPSSASTGCLLDNSGQLLVYLDGENCCTDCTINVSASVFARGGMSVLNTASSSVTSAISVATQGAGTSAGVSGSLSQNGGWWVINGNPPLPIAPPAGGTERVPILVESSVGDSCRGDDRF